MTALVTGATGWLGSRLVELLARGIPEVPRLAAPQTRAIRCLVPRGADVRGLEAGRVSIVEGDLTDAASLAPLFAGAAGATVFHCAGLIHPDRWAGDFYRVNTEGTRNLLAAAAAAGVRRFVHVSSNSPFGVNPRPDHTFDESAPYHPYMGYGRSKMLSEELVRASKLETVIVRPPWFYGPNQPPRQSLFFRMIKAGRVPIVGSGENRRSMGYVDNVAQGLMLAELTEKAAGQAYWIADRRPYTMNEIVDTIERVMERDFGMTVAHRRVRVPGLLSELAWAADATLQAAGLYHQKIHVLSEMNKTIACSVEKAVRELGYAPAVELEEGMRRSIKWALDAGQEI